VPFQSVSAGAFPQGLSSSLESSLSSYSITSPPQLPPYAMPLSQLHFQQPNLAQLLMQYPHFCQQQPGSGVTAEFDFDTQQLTQQLPSVASNLSLSSSSSVCFHETSLADQLDFPLMNSPQGANVVLNSDAYSLSPITPTDFTSQLLIVKHESGLTSNSEYCPLENFVAAQPAYSRTPMHRVSPSPFYGRAASALTSHAESKVNNLLSCSAAYAFCICLLPLPSAYAFCLCLLPSAFAFCLCLLLYAIYPEPSAFCLCLLPSAFCLLSGNAVRRCIACSCVVQCSGSPCAALFCCSCKSLVAVVWESDSNCLEFAMLCLADNSTTVGLISLVYNFSGVMQQLLYEPPA